MRCCLVISAMCLVAIGLGCGGIGGFVYEQQLVGDLKLIAIDTREQMELVGDSCRVPETVYAVGWNESHVIAKRHPPSESGQRNDKTVTEHYIVVVRDHKVYGPFDRSDFVLHCDLLGVSKDLDFTQTFRELE